MFDDTLRQVNFVRLTDSILVKAPICYMMHGTPMAIDCGACLVHDKCLVNADIEEWFTKVESLNDEMTKL